MTSQMSAPEKEPVPIASGFRLVLPTSKVPAAIAMKHQHHEMNNTDQIGAGGVWSNMFQQETASGEENN
jgi:hypothetical protein